MKENEAAQGVPGSGRGPDPAPAAFGAVAWAEVVERFRRWKQTLPAGAAPSLVSFQDPDERWKEEAQARQAADEDSPAADAAIQHFYDTLKWPRTRSSVRYHIHRRMDALCDQMQQWADLPWPLAVCVADPRAANQDALLAFLLIEFRPP